MKDSVLVAHTSKEIYSFLKDVFEKEGFVVYHENDGVNALKNIIEKKPCLIFMGSDIPNIGYSDILNIVDSQKKNFTTCLIIEHPDDEKPAPVAGFDAFLNCPLNTDSAKAALDALIFKVKLKSKGISQKKKLYQTEVFLIHLLEHIRVAIISIDNAGRILSFNRKAQKLWGYQRNFIIGRNFDSLCIEENKGKYAPLFIEETIKSGSYEGILFFERADGTQFPGNLQTSVIKGDEGDEGIVVVVRDLTGQRSLEHKLVEKKKLATLGMVVEGVAHEVRNPLISIGGFARRLLKKVGEDFPYRNYLKVIVEDVSRLETMVKDIESYVHFTKLHKLNFKKGRIEKVLDMSLDLIEKKRLKNIKVVKEYDTAVPTFFLDVGYLVEMFFNLFENAIEAMPAGGKLEIITLHDNNTSSIIKIIDTGLGIPKDRLGEIFDLFYTTKMSGVGLGLAKVQLVVEDHGGRIDVDSIKGHGTTVTITLPLERRQKIRR
jgi:PAS domain S-box-containing protein